MKRRNLTESSIVPCYLSWSVISYLLILCFFSCACRNKTNSVQLNPVDNNSSTTKSEQHNDNGSIPAYAPPAQLQTQYNEIVKTVKAKPGYSLFGEFLDRGKYIEVFSSTDKLEYYLLIPTDVELKKLDNNTLTKLIYPDYQDKSNLDFFLAHLAFSLVDPAVKKGIRTMAGKPVVIDENLHNITIDGKQFPVIDEAKLPSSVRLFFIDNFLN